MREIRVSPDGEQVAIRTDFPEDSFRAWGVMTATDGGHYNSSEKCADWTVLTRDE